ncbi:flagellar export protein FliJ [Fibrobacterota bacterium]
MQRFSFKLEAVLNHRQWLEDEAKRALGLELHKLDSLRIALTKLREEHAGLLSQRRNLPDLPPEQHLHYVSYCGKLLMDMEAQKGRINAQQKAVDKKNRDLHEAMLERKKLEKLRQRDFKEYQVYKKRKETSVLDENASNFIRRFRNVT